MAFYAVGGGEAGPSSTGTSSGVYGGNANDTIIATPFDAAPGTYSYCVDPKNGTPVVDTYGFTTGIGGNPAFLTVMFMWRFAVVFDTSITIAELGQSAGQAYARRLVMLNTENLEVLDEDDDEIGKTGPAYFAVNTDYWFLWYVDLRVEANSRDIVWVWKAGAWDKAVDETGHGDGDPANINRLTFGTSAGKGLPTAGGPFYVDEMAMQVLNVSPNTTPIGSVTTLVKMPVDDGVDQDFDTGAPDFQDVDEIPPTGVADFDEGDATGEKNSYEPDDATVDDTPLAIQVVGEGAPVAPAPTIRTYILEDGTRDYSDDNWEPTGGYHKLGPVGSNVNKTWNEVNDQAITEALFNTIEVGVEMVSVTTGSYRLSQIGAEYMKNGPKALPGDFPTISEQTITTEASGAVLGSANPMVF